MILVVEVIIIVWMKETDGIKILKNKMIKVVIMRNMIHQIYKMKLFKNRNNLFKINKKLVIKRAKTRNKLIIIKTKTIIIVKIIQIFRGIKTNQRNRKIRRG